FVRAEEGSLWEIRRADKTDRSERSRLLWQPSRREWWRRSPARRLESFGFHRHVQTRVPAAHATGHSLSPKEARRSHRGRSFLLRPARSGRDAAAALR